MRTPLPAARTILAIRLGEITAIGTSGPNGLVFLERDGSTRSLAYPDVESIAVDEIRGRLYLADQSGVITETSAA